MLTFKELVMKSNLHLPRKTSLSIRCLALSSLVLAMNSAFAMSDQSLREITQQRLAGDRTNACFAVAVVEDKTVSRLCVCRSKK
jgi:hypothetical protein